MHQKEYAAPLLWTKVLLQAENSTKLYTYKKMFAPLVRLGKTKQHTKNPNLFIYTKILVIVWFSLMQQSKKNIFYSTLKKSL